MRYTLMGFMQSVACAKKITPKELVFLRWFMDFMTTLKMKWIMVSQKTYFWVDSETVMQELPIMGITYPENLRRFLRGMVKKGVLEYHLFKGNQPFYMVNHKTISELLSYVPKARKKRR